VGAYPPLLLEGTYRLFICWRALIRLHMSASTNFFFAHCGHLSP
jgi:hypothetical protein